MRNRLISVALLLVTGCAAQPQAGNSQTTAAAAGQPAARGEPTTVEAARKAGYKIVNQDGKPLYCREELQTGSHARKVTICLTEEELAMVRDAARRNVDQMQRATAIPQGK